jgi:AraC-like DNA-binding protein/quercetin dioxygenase-like cupin family protein
MLWISDVTEFSQPLTGMSPIGLRRFTLDAGLVMEGPERHPYCEFSVVLDGEITQFVGNEKLPRLKGDVFLAGPGLPHWAEGVSYPYTSLAIFFLPSFLIEMGPQGDGLRLLRRFLVGGDIRSRMIRPPASMAVALGDGFAVVEREFADARPGREIRLRAALGMLLTDFDRWEQSQLAARAPIPGEQQWDRLQRALRYLQDHYAEAIYACDLSKHLSMSETRVKALFRETLGIPWGRYLQTYRVQQATSLFAAGELNVTEIAAAVGFETLGHFESTFRALAGMTPTVFARKCRSNHDKASALGVK